MPNSNGFNAIEAIKDFLPISCPILVVTGHATEENIIRAQELGATEYITKPLKVDKLIGNRSRVQGLSAGGFTVQGSKVVKF